MVTDNLVATNIERLVYAYLVRRNISFRFQTSLMGGFFALGGAVVDFLLDDRMLAWRIQGEFWHRGVEKEGSDLLQREMLTALGWTVVDLLADDLENRLNQTLRLALQGQEVLR